MIANLNSIVIDGTLRKQDDHYILKTKSPNVLNEYVYIEIMLSDLNRPRVDLLLSKTDTVDVRVLGAISEHHGIVIDANLIYIEEKGEKNDTVHCYG